MYFAFFILLSVFLHGKQTDGLYICLASYVISVRRTKSLLTASFRFYLTIDTLAVQLYTSLSPRRVRDFHPLERAHGAQTKISPAIAWLTIQKFIIFYCPLDGEHTIAGGLSYCHTSKKSYAVAFSTTAYDFFMCYPHFSLFIHMHPHQSMRRIMVRIRFAQRAISSRVMYPFSNASCTRSSYPFAILISFPAFVSR